MLSAMSRISICLGSMLVSTAQLARSNPPLRGTALPSLSQTRVAGASAQFCSTNALGILGCSPEPHWGMARRPIDGIRSQWRRARPLPGHRLLELKVLLFVHPLHGALCPGVALFTDICDVQQALGEQNWFDLPRLHRLMATGTHHDRRLLLLECAEHVNYELSRRPGAGRLATPPSLGIVPGTAKIGILHALPRRAPFARHQRP